MDYSAAIGTAIGVVGVVVSFLQWRLPKSSSAGHGAIGRDKRLPSSNVAIEVAGLERMEGWGWSGEKLLRKFIELDYETLEGLTESDEGNPRQWAPVFTNHPETWRMLLNEDEAIVGYWHFAPLVDRDFGRAMAGELLDSEITADRIATMAVPGHYRIYFVQICLSQGYRTIALKRKLFESLFDVLEALAAEGVYVAEVTANAYTEVGVGLCRDFGLTFACEHKVKGKIFAGTIASVLSGRVASGRQVLRQLYMAQGLLAH